MLDHKEPAMLGLVLSVTPSGLGPTPGGRRNGRIKLGKEMQPNRTPPHRVSGPKTATVQSRKGTLNERQVWVFDFHVSLGNYFQNETVLVPKTN